MPRESSLLNNLNELPLEEGQQIHRRHDLHDRYGGNPQSGISPCGKFPYVFLFISPNGGEYGYKDNRISENEFVISGEGQEGKQKMKRGNAAILNHVEKNRALHLLSKISSGYYEYLGRFVYVSHKFEPGVDKLGNTREMIQFRLKKY